MCRSNNGIRKTQLCKGRYLVILQFGSLFSSLVSGIGSGLSSLVKAVAPQAFDIGRQFLDREIQRKLTRRRTQQIGTVSIAARNMLYEQLK